MATSPSSVFEVVPNTGGKARTGVCSLVDSGGVDLPAVSFAQAAFVEDADDSSDATLAASIDALRDALIAANIIAPEPEA